MGNSSAKPVDQTDSYTLVVQNKLKYIPTCDNPITNTDKKKRRKARAKE